MSDVVFHRLDRDTIVQRLHDYVELELTPRPEVNEVVLIGSLARGDWSARSDAEIVVMVDTVRERGPFRGSDYAPSTSVGVPVDILVFTPEDAGAWSPRFGAEVDGGVLLYRRRS
jgi:predicted nucleotidyltransferase